MTDDEYQFLANFFKTRSGLVLTPEKIYLIENRLLPIAKRRNLENLPDFVNALKAGTDKALIDEVTDAMTVNETFFFRDGKPFELFKNKVLPDLIKRRAAQKSIKIWCAAAALGQEPYTIAMLLLEAKALMAGWRQSLLATDISNSALAKATAGKYTEFEVQRGLPPEYLDRYFTKNGVGWEVKQQVKDLIKFQHFNLLNSPAGTGPFDIVFCRNVLIYFDEQTKREVLKRIRSVMTDDGLLFMGGAETVVGLSDEFAPVTGERGIYEIK